MAEGHKPIVERKAKSRPQQALEFEQYRRNDGSIGGRFVMLPNGYDDATAEIERTDYRGAEPWSEEVWERIERWLGITVSPDLVLRDELREAVFAYGACCAQAVHEPDVRWGRVRDSLARIEKVARQLLGCLGPHSSEDPRARRERETIRTLIVSCANRGNLRIPNTTDPFVETMIRTAAAVLPARDFDAPQGDGDGNRLLARLDEVVARLPEIANRARKDASERTEAAPRGPRTGDELPYLVARLATIYEARTGRAPDVIENPRHPDGYLGGFYALVRAIVEHLPEGFGAVSRKTPSAIGKDLKRLLRGTSKGGYRSAHVRRQADGAYQVVLSSRLTPSMARHFGKR